MSRDMKKEREKEEGDDWKSVSDDDSIHERKLSDIDEREGDGDGGEEREEKDENEDDEEKDNDDLDVDKDIAQDDPEVDVTNMIESIMAEGKPRRSNSADDAFNLNGGNSTVSNREESRSAGSSRQPTQSFDTEEGSYHEKRPHRKQRKSVTRNWSDGERGTPSPVNNNPQRRSDESEEESHRRPSSEDLSTRYRLESFDNPFSFDDTEPQSARRLEDDDDDESFTFRSGIDHGMYSDPSDDENEPKKKNATPAIPIPQNNNPRLPPDYFENEENSKTDLFPDTIPDHQPTLSLTSSMKALQKATSVVVPVDDQDRPRTESDRSRGSRGRLGSDKDNETRSPMAASYSSTNSSSISPEPLGRISALSPKSPPSLISDQLHEEMTLSRSGQKNITNQPSPLQMMASERWNNTKKIKPAFAKFTEVHSFANAVKIVPDCDGALVLCATADSTIRLIDAITGKVQGMYEGHSDRVLAVSINEKIPGHDDTVQYVVAGSRDETVCVWNFKTRVCVQVLNGHDGAVWAVAVYVSLNAPPMAFSGSSDCSIRSWNILTGEVLHIFKGHSDTVLALSLYNGGQYTLSNDCRVVSGGADHMVRVWDMSTGRHTRMLEGHTDDVNAVCIVEDTFGRLFHGVKIVSGGRDRTIRIWDLQRGAQIAEFSGHADCVYGVCGIVGKFATMQAAPTKNPRPTTLPHATSTRSTIAGHMNRSSSVWVKQPDPSDQSKDTIPDSFIVASCSEDRTIKLWNVMEERLLITSKLHKGSVKGISMNPINVDQTFSPAILLASCSWDKSVLYYDVDNLLAGEEKSSCCCLS